MKTFAFVFARGGSKGVPRKNVRVLGGKPLIAHSIELAKQIPQVDDVFVSTDDDTIAEKALLFGANIINRPYELAQDNSPEWLAWKHAVKWVEEKITNFDVFLSLPTTCPLRNRDDIESCLNKLDEKSDIVISVTDSCRSPWFNMVKLIKNDFVDLLIESSNKICRRQDVPKAFDMTTAAYVTRPEFVKVSNGIFEGKVRAVKIPQERAIDIDTETDFIIAEYMYKHLSENKQ